MTRKRPGGRRRWAVGATGAAALTLASCTSSATVAGGGSPGHPAAAGAAHPTTTTTTIPPATTTTTAPEQPGWTTLSTGPRGIAIDKRIFPQPDGSQVVVSRFLFDKVNFQLHIGTQDPPTGGATLGPESGPSISPAEQPLLLGCFNGGFKAFSKAGGVEANGQVLTPLIPGEASLVLDTAGFPWIGRWQQDVPLPGIPTASVRQNLSLLVQNGQPSPLVHDIGTWGASVSGAVDARSALGQDPQGDLLYAASMSTLPSDLANALISAGATTAMQLDINPTWIQLDTAATPGAPLQTQVPGQNRPADQCQVGWTRDFISVLAIG